MRFIHINEYEYMNNYVQNVTVTLIRDFTRTRLAPIKYRLLSLTDYYLHRELNAVAEWLALRTH